MKRKILLFAALSATLFVSLCSKTSPLYAFNDWDDANVFLTIGTALKHGMVPYRDLVDVKGPALHMLYALASLVSERTWTGVWLMQLLSATLFLFYAYRTLAVVRPQASLLSIPVLAAVVFAAPCYPPGGAAEELALPLCAYILYVGALCIAQRRLPSARQCLGVGVAIGVVFWIKYTLIGFFGGWVLGLAWLALRLREPKPWARLGQLTAGFALATAPIIAYFALNGALSDLWDGYFFRNIFGYSTASEYSTLGSLKVWYVLRPLLLLRYNIAYVGLCAIGLPLLLKRRRALGLYALAAYLMAWGLFSTGGRSWFYSPLITAPVLPFALGALLNAWPQKWAMRRGAVASLCTFVACLAYAFSTSYKPQMMKERAEDVAALRFASVIGQEPEAKVLTYGISDVGIYVATGLRPVSRYECVLEGLTDDCYKEHNALLEEGVADYVVASVYSHERVMGTGFYEVVDSGSRRLPRPIRGVVQEVKLYRRVR